MAIEISYKTVYPEKTPGQIIDEQVILNSYTRRNIRNRKSLELDLLTSDNFENEVLDELITLLDENVKVERIGVESEDNFKNDSRNNGYFRELQFLSQCNAEIIRIEIKAPVSTYEGSDVVFATNSGLVGEDIETDYYLKLWDRYNNFLGCSTNTSKNKRDDTYVFYFNNIKCDGFFIKCTVSKENKNRNYLAEKKEKLFINYSKLGENSSVIRSFVPLGCGSINFSTFKNRGINQVPSSGDKAWSSKVLIKNTFITPGYLEKFTIRAGGILAEEGIINIGNNANLWVNFFKIKDNVATFIGSSASPVELTDSKNYSSTVTVDERGQSLSEFQKIYIWDDFDGIYDGKIFIEQNTSIGIVFTTEDVEDKQSIWDACTSSGSWQDNSNAPTIGLRFVAIANSETTNWVRNANNKIISGNVIPYLELTIDENYNDNNAKGLTYYPNINVYYTETMLLTDKIIGQVNKN